MNDLTNARQIKFPKIFSFLFRSKRYKESHGGRGSGKSWNYARALLLLAKDRPLRVLCVRELQNSINESVYKLLCNQIVALGLQNDYDIQKTIIRSKCGSEFIFAGIRMNTTKIKSMEDIDICWVEEAETISNRSWEILIPTIRKEECYIYSDNQPSTSEIWITWNPDLETDPTYVRFIKNRDALGEQVHSVTVNWEHNPYFPLTLSIEKDAMYANDPDTAAHVYGGQCRTNSASQIMKGKYIIEAFEPDRSVFSKWNGPYYGADWGFSNDPSVLVKLWIYEKRLYIEREWVGYHVENDELANHFRRIDSGDVLRHTILADNSRPETISHVKKKGHLNVQPADKWKGSIEDGIAHMRNYEKIVLHPNCVHALQEFRLYSYKVDSLSGLPTTLIEDKNNHVIDAIRYALQPLIKRKRSILDAV